MSDLYLYDGDVSNEEPTDDARFDRLRKIRLVAADAIEGIGCALAQLSQAELAIQMGGEGHHDIEGAALAFESAGILAVDCEDLCFAMLAGDDDAQGEPDAAPYWRPVSRELPDSDMTVMIYNAAWDEPVWMGWLDGDVWRDVDGLSLEGPSPEVAPPTHWAHLPEPPEEQS